MALRYTNLGLLEYTTCSPLYDGEDSTKPINHAFSGLISVLIFPSVLQLFINRSSYMLLFCNFFLMEALTNFVIVY